MEKFYIKDLSKKFFFQFFRNILVILILCTSNLFAQKDIRSLKRQDVESIEIIIDDTQLKNAGNELSFGIEAKLKNNKVVKTKGYLNGSVRWNNFDIEVIGAKYQSGTIHIQGKEDLIRPDFIVVVARSKHHSDVFARKRIELNYVTKIELFNTREFSKAPGNRIFTGIIKTFNNNQQKVIKQTRSVDKELDNYDIICNGGYMYSGKFVITNDIFKIINHRVGFTIYHKDNPNLSASFETTLDYIDNFSYYSYGLSGEDGDDGDDGDPGDNGDTGCNGENGRNGGHGDDGFDGDDGPDLEVYADAYYDTILHCDLVKVSIYNLSTNKSSHYLVNPLGGRINIHTTGGSGGDGGDGGVGGKGGNGGSGKRTERTITKTVPCGEEETCEETEIIVEIENGGNGGDGGKGGNGGFGGDGGCGGNIYAYYSKSVAPYEHIIKLESIPGDEGEKGDGGDGGDAGKGESPSGSNGNNGCEGSDGKSGYDGCRGKIYIYDWDGWLDFSSN